MLLWVVHEKRGIRTRVSKYGPGSSSNSRVSTESTTFQVGGVMSQHARSTEDARFNLQYVASDPSPGAKDLALACWSAYTPTALGGVWAGSRQR
jgi:hypothetical protein